jgi:trigger factor
MKTSIKYVSDTKVIVTITVDKSEIEDAEKVALSKLSKKVKAPGFRAGKVPPSIAAKHVDPMALAEQTLDDALSKAVSVAFTEENIPALDRPEVEIKKYVPGQELEFTAEAEVLPKITLGKYKKMGVKKVVGKVEKSEVDDVIERMRKGFAKRKDVKRAAKVGDETVIDFVGKKDGEPFDGGSSQDYPLELGSGQFIPGFEEGVVGHKAGEEFDVPVKFPEDYHAKALAGADVVFTVTLKSIKEVVLPEVDDKFAEKAGPFKTVKEMRADVEREIAAGRERDALENFKEELINKLIEVSTIPVPEILVKDQSRSIEQDMGQNLAYQGMTLQQYLESKDLTHDKWVETEVRDAAVKRVKAGLVLAELSKVEKVTATDEELVAKITQFQEQYNRTGEDFTSPEMQRDMANRLITEKTIDRLLELN